MTEQLAHTPTTVFGRDAWRDAIQCLYFADQTPLTQPANPSKPFEVLVSGFFSRSNCHVIITTNDGARVSATIEPTDLVQEPLERFTLSANDPVEHPGNIALRDLQGWLGMPLDAIVGLAGLSASTRAFWRNNPAAPIRPSKTGRFLRLHTAIGLLVGEQGVEKARLTLRGEGWLAEAFDERRLIELETRVRNELMPDGLQAPAYLSRGGLTRKQLRARMLADLGDERAQQDLEREITRVQPSHDAPESP